ncbi:hypothetical protein UCREL1_2059 [Eutypa lata UCREL1]|uniref:DUF7730 domain-containing protein n=1 Tax=Eutypa lata (strain UCR-EL1) TaxID=1287681 RepID=M7TLV5_EUTLA|nr:hypothetical protein UCREL1_2059 [Eutypa lata UCREL1]
MAQMAPLELRIAQKKKDMEEHQPNANTTTTTSFLDLPLELRNEVYAHLFVQDKPINCYKVWFTTAERHLRRLGREKNEDGSAAHDENCCGVKRYGCAHYDKALRPLTGILRTCRAVGAEARDVLYGRNTFWLGVGGSHETSPYLRLKTVGPDNLRRVRHLRAAFWCGRYAWYLATRHPEERSALFRPPGDGDGDGAQLWAPLVDGLRSLVLILELPLSGLDDRLGWPVWVAHVEPLLRFLGERIDPGETQVIVDDNYSPLLCEAVDRCLGRTGFRRARTPEGDVHYLGKRFDPGNLGEPVESGA